MKHNLKIRIIEAETEVIRSYQSFDGLKEAEITAVSIGDFSSEEEANNFAALFPKSYKAGIWEKYGEMPDETVDFSTIYYGVCFSFNVFHTNDTTGAVNEAAVARRTKVINKVAEVTGQKTDALIRVK